jgi:hypothetical protein
MHFGNSSDLIEPVKSGSDKALAVSTPERMPELPDVPALAETIPGFEYIAWNGYAATGGVPAEVRTRLAQAPQTVAADPDLIKTFANLGIQSVGSTPEQAVVSIGKDMPVMHRSSTWPASGANRRESSFRGLMRQREHAGERFDLADQIGAVALAAAGALVAAVMPSVLVGIGVVLAVASVLRRLVAMRILVG